MMEEECPNCYALNEVRDPSYIFGPVVCNFCKKEYLVDSASSPQKKIYTYEEFEQLFEVHSIKTETDRIHVYYKKRKLSDFR